MEAKYIEVSAEVRYWEDATVEGHDDTDGTLIPFRDGALWKPVIRLKDGIVMGWPDGICADIHYKVCDAGEYWLLDQDRKRIGKWTGHYVPTAFLNQEDRDSDYIIFRVDKDGSVLKWKKPPIDPSQWEPVAAVCI